MPELALQTYKIWPIDTQEASISYGSWFISEEPFGEKSYSGAWNASEVQYQLKGAYRFTTTAETFLVPSTPPKGEDPFTQSNLIETEQSQLQEVIYQIKRSPSILFRQIGNKLLSLFNSAKEDDSSSVGISINSLRNFLNFLRSHLDLKCPIISLTPQNNIYTSWRAGQDLIFSIHFLPSADVRFVIFRTNDRHPDRQIRISGATTTDVLKETVEPHGVWEWISE